MRGVNEFESWVTIAAHFPDGVNYIDVGLWRTFNDYDDALRHNDSLWVKPFGAVAWSLHALYPEVVQFDAEYDIEDGDIDDFFIETIWYEKE